MFEAKKTEFVNKTFRLEKTLVDKLSNYASETDISLNSLVAQCCEYALSNISATNNTNTTNNTTSKDFKK